MLKKREIDLLSIPSEWAGNVRDFINDKYKRSDKIIFVYLKDVSNINRIFSEIESGNDGTFLFMIPGQRDYNLSVLWNYCNNTAHTKFITDNISINDNELFDLVYIYYKKLYTWRDESYKCINSTVMLQDEIKGFNDIDNKFMSIVNDLSKEYNCVYMQYGLSSDKWNFMNEKDKLIISFDGDSFKNLNQYVKYRIK